MQAEIQRLNSMGIEVIPKLNFSTTHNGWMGDYSHMVSSKPYYRMCEDVIRDVVEIFGHPRYFHIGLDEVSEKAYSEEGEAAHLVDYAESLVFDIAQGRDSKNFRHISDVINEVYQNLHKMAEGEAAQGTKTGFSGVDNVLAGMGNSDLILVGARPGMGKTSFALNIATNVAVQSKKTVCIFSLEMSAEQLVNRIISSEAMIDSVALRTGKLDAKQWNEIAKTTTQLAGSNILIDDTTGMTVTGMKGKLRRVKDLGLVVVDYLGLMKSDKRMDITR